MRNINLIRATAEDAEQIWNMQKVAFADLLEKYQDFDTNPASEPKEKTVKRLNSASSYFYFICADVETVGAIRVIDKKSDQESKRISPVFIMPQHRRKGYAQAAILQAEKIHGSDNWELDTILQEKGNCCLYEKMGYRRTDKIKQINSKLTLIYYKK